MAAITITIVGQDLFKIVEHLFVLVGFNEINDANLSMLGNLKMLTYEVEVFEEEVIQKRNDFLNMVAEDDKRLMAFYKAGDWMRILITRPI